MRALINRLQCCSDSGQVSNNIRPIDSAIALQETSVWGVCAARAECCLEVIALWPCGYAVKRMTASAKASPGGGSHLETPRVCNRDWARETLAKNRLDEAAVCKALKVALLGGLRNPFCACPELALDQVTRKSPEKTG